MLDIVSNGRRSFAHALSNLYMLMIFRFGTLARFVAADHARIAAVVVHLRSLCCITATKVERDGNLCSAFRAEAAILVALVCGVRTLVG